MATRKPLSLITSARSSSFLTSLAQAILTSRSQSYSNKKAINAQAAKVLEAISEELTRTISKH